MISTTLPSEIADRVWSTQQFQREQNHLHRASVYYSITGVPPADAPSESVAFRLLQSATFLAASSNSLCRQTAYRIVVSAFNLYRDRFRNLPSLLHVVFGRLGNFPTIEHLYRALGEPKEYDIPAGALYELVGHEVDNTVRIASRQIVLTDFQRDVWKALAQTETISVSAPTSAGKSYLLQQYLVQTISRGASCFTLYLVPTRAR